MRKWLPLLLFLIFAYDIAVDSFDADCLDASETCHACICQTHSTAPASTGSAPVIASSSRVTAADYLLTPRVNDKSFFHPPKALA